MRRSVSLALRSVLVIWSTITLSFFLIRLIPGGPADYLRAQFVQRGQDPGDVSKLVDEYYGSKTSGPLHEQYFDYIGSVLQFDLGTSFIVQEPVADILATALPWTVFVGVLSIIASYLIGIPLGALFAYRSQSAEDYLGSAIGVLTSAIPYYVMALGLLYFFGFQLELFPTGGRYESTLEPALDLPFVTSAFYHATLPALSQILVGIGGIAIGMRANAMSILGDDFLRVARLRGLGESRILTRYVAWNGILPMYTGMMLRIGFIFGGSVILERIFTYKGVGWYLFRGINSRDYPLMMGGFLLITIVVTIAIYIADNTYGLIDPRADISADDSHEFSPLKGLLKLLTWPRRKWKARSTSAAETETTFEESGESIYPEATGHQSSYPEQARDFLRRSRQTLAVLFEDWRAAVGIAILAFYLVAGLLGPVVLPEPTVGQGDSLLTPFENMDHPLGTNSLGQSLLGLLVYSIEPLSKMMFAGAMFTMVIATIVATLGGYVGGAVDRVLTTVTDMFIVIPGLPLFIVVVSVLNPTNPFIIGIILSINAWAGLARGLRSEVIKVRNHSYVEASRVIGLPVYKIISRDVLPNIMSLITIAGVGSARRIIYASVGLYFLGVLPYTQYNWGIIMNNAYNNDALTQPELFYWLFEPMAAIVFLSLGLVLLAQSMDRVFNPRIRTRDNNNV